MGVAVWYGENRKEVHQKVEMLRRESVAMEAVGLLREDREGGLKGIVQMLATLPTAEKEEVLRALSRA